MHKEMRWRILPEALMLGLPSFLSCQVSPGRGKEEKILQVLFKYLDLLLPDGVVTSSIVVGGVLLAGDQLLGVEQLPIGSSPNLIYKILRVHSR